MPDRSDARRSRQLQRGRPAWLLPLAVALTLLPTVPARGDDPDNCLFCHQYRGLGRFNAEEDTFHLYFVDAEYQHAALGAHARVGCTDCHERSEVAVIPHKPVTHVNCTQECHLRDESGLAQRFSHANVAEMLESSIHSLETLDSLEFARGSLLHDGQSRCLYCHDEPVFRNFHDLFPFLGPAGEQSLDRCEVCHGGQIPIDTGYYFRHVTSRIQHARPPIEMAQVCAVCHSDELIKERFDLPDATVGYAKSFHGKAALLGAPATADCVSCHVKHGENAHLMRSQSNPLSSTHPDHKADSCRSTACHPGADKTIGAAAVHFTFPEMTSIEILLCIAFVLLTLATFGPSLVLTLLELLQLVIGREHADEGHHHRRLTFAVLMHPEGRERLRRFTSFQNIQHWVLVVLFFLLAATGFPMKFASHHWARVVIDAIGGLSVARNIHHWAGIGLVLGFLLHVVYIAQTLFKNAAARQPNGKRVGPIRAFMGLPMFIGPGDLLKAVQMLAYLMFLRKHPPTFGRFTIDQKFEYIGVAWGTVLLGVTGALLWGEQLASRFISGRVFNIALIAHTYEAFLAVIHVGILHICHVVLNPPVFPLSKATITGETPISQLTESHSDLVEEVAQDLNIKPMLEVQHG